METAIKIASEGAYQAKYGCENGFEHMVLDPLFWQALGKAEGWNPHDKTSTTIKVEFWPMSEWEARWHQFIHHLAEEKDADEFFKELLK